MYRFDEKSRVVRCLSFPIVHPPPGYLAPQVSLLLPFPTFLLVRQTAVVPWRRTPYECTSFNTAIKKTRGSLHVVTEHGCKPPVIFPLARASFAILFFLSRVRGKPYHGVDRLTLSPPVYGSFSIATRNRGGFAARCRALVITPRSSPRPSLSLISISNPFYNTAASTALLCRRRVYRVFLTLKLKKQISRFIARRSRARVFIPSFVPGGTLCFLLFTKNSRGCAILMPRH